MGLCVCGCAFSLVLVAANSLLSFCCAMSPLRFSHKWHWLLRSNVALPLLPSGLSLDCKLTPPLLQHHVGLGRCKDRREACLYVCDFAFLLVMAAASPWLLYCYAISMSLPLRAKCCHWPSGPSNCCVRATAPHTAPTAHSHAHLKLAVSIVDLSDRFMC